jgi:hypothetical protein
MGNALALQCIAYGLGSMYYHAPYAIFLWRCMHFKQDGHASVGGSLQFVYTWAEDMGPNDIHVSVHSHFKRIIA